MASLVKWWWCLYQYLDQIKQDDKAVSVKKQFIPLLQHPARLPAKDWWQLQQTRTDIKLDTWRHLRMYFWRSFSASWTTGSNVNNKSNFILQSVPWYIYSYWVTKVFNELAALWCQKVTYRFARKHCIELRLYLFIPVHVFTVFLYNNCLKLVVITSKADDMM